VRVDIWSMRRGPNTISGSASSAIKPSVFAWPSVWTISPTRPFASFSALRSSTGACFGVLVVLPPPPPPPHAATTTASA